MRLRYKSNVELHFLHSPCLQIVQEVCCPRECMRLRYKSNVGLHFLHSPCLQIVQEVCSPRECMRLRYKSNVGLHFLHSPCLQIVQEVCCPRECMRLRYKSNVGLHFLHSPCLQIVQEVCCPRECMRLRYKGNQFRLIRACCEACGCSISDNQQMGGLWQHLATHRSRIYASEQRNCTGQNFCIIMVYNGTVLNPVSCASRVGILQVSFTRVSWWKAISSRTKPIGLCHIKASQVCMLP